MDLHLNSDQIDELLQAAKDSKPNRVNGHDHLEDARRHLKDCAACQARIRAHAQAIASLALLKSTMPGAKGPICPPHYVWLDIAAGILDEDAENDLSHAAQCDHCGSLLRQAKQDFASELTPEEETMIADLPSATSAWQGRLAVKLQNSQARPPALSSTKDRSPSFPGSLVGPWQLAFAVAIIGLILLGFRAYRQTADQLAQNRQATAEIQRLKQSLLQQSTQIAELTAQSKKSSPLKAPGPQPTGNVRIASLLLEPGVTRGISALKQLTVPRGTDLAKIALRLEATPDGLLREDLVNGDGEIMWTQEQRLSESEKRTNSLSLLFPVSVLTPNDYQLVLSRQAPGGFERFAAYTFRVTR